MKITYKKLVRDRIPQLIEESGRKCTYRVLNDDEYFDALVNKVIEEIEEYRVSRKEEELSDVYEALDCLVKFKEYEPMHLDYLRLIRREARGSYIKKILLEEVDDEE